MGQEANFQLTVSCDKPPTISGIGISIPSAGQPPLKLTVSGNNFKRGTQTFTTTPTAVDLGAVATPGFVVIRNTSDANDLLIQMGSSGAPVPGISPGMFAAFQAASGTLYGKASTGTIVGDIFILED